ncbi:stac [Anaeramoeba flamelloides]|uniref:Stac n=1 Tax=Anaeramoeba flamelloides TaxID=1746091 RepID=A0ABQ8X3N7_9EUKA|nr:stac [Anaeramoeba flamelloides]
MNQKTLFWVETLYAYNGEDESQISFGVGEKIQVIDDGSEWWAGFSETSKGYFPSNFVRVLNENEIPQQRQQRSGGGGGGGDMMNGILGGRSGLNQTSFPKKKKKRTTNVK